MARQAILERLGWTFTRIRGSAFFRDEEQAMRPVFERLDELGIAPGLRDDGSAEDDSLIKELEAIVREFHQDDENEAGEVAANAMLAVSALSPRKATPIEPDPQLFTLSVVGENEKLQVEVGDRITYVDLAEPNYKNSFRIVADGHDPATGLVNKAKPIAQAFLGAAEGSIVQVPIANRPTKRFKLLKIEREERGT